MNQEKADVSSVAGFVKQLWEGLNTDVTPVFKNLLNQLKAVYAPRLEPIKAGGIILDWIDAETGGNPWFS
jgi:hypothetical protein